MTSCQLLRGTFLPIFYSKNIHMRAYNSTDTKNGHEIHFLIPKQFNAIKPI